MPRVEQEQEHPPKKTEFGVTRAELEVIVTNSIGTAILNPLSLEEVSGENGQNFKPEQCDPIRIVWVQTKDGRARHIVDGHHRAKAFYDNYDSITDRLLAQDPEKYAEYQLQVRDVTENYALLPDQQEPTVSMQTYLKLLAPHTKKQEAVVRERASAYVLKYWDSIADPEIAQTCSALAALTILEDAEKYQEAAASLGVTVPSIGDYFIEKPAVLVDQNEDQRHKTEAALVTTYTFIKEMGTTVEEAADEAFTVIALKKDMYDAAEVEWQIGALFNLPEAREKADDFRYTKSLATGVRQTFSHLTEVTAPHQIKSIRAAIFDSTLTSGQLSAILDNENPKRIYEALTKERARAAKNQTNIQAYEATYGLITAQEKTYLKRDNVSEGDFPTIYAVTEIRKEALHLLDNLPSHATDQQRTALRKAMDKLHGNTAHLSGAAADVRKKINAIVCGSPSEEKPEPQDLSESGYAKPKKTDVTREQLQEVRTKLRTATRRVAKLERANMGLEAKVADLTKEKTDLALKKDKELGVAMGTISRLETTKSGLENMVARLTEEKRDLVREHTAEVRAETRTVVRLGDANTALKEKVTDLTKEKTDLAKERDEAQKATEAARHELSQLLADQTAKDDEIARLQAEKTEVTAENHTSAAQIETARRIIVDLRSKLSRRQSGTVVFESGAPKVEQITVPVTELPTFIDHAATVVFSSLVSQWDTILPHLKAVSLARKPLTGKETLVGGLSESMLDLIKHLGLPTDSPEFNIMSARHYSLAIETALGDAKEDESLQTVHRQMEEDITTYQATHTVSPEMSEALSVCLYLHKDNPTRGAILTIINSSLDDLSKDEQVKEKVDRYKKENGDTLHLYEMKMLGKKGK